MGAHYDTFQQRKEISFLAKDTAIRLIKDVSLLQKLSDCLNSLKQENSAEYVVGEWYTHKGFGVSVDGHGTYSLMEARSLAKKYGRGDPFFCYWTYSDIERKLGRLTAAYRGG